MAPVGRAETTEYLPSNNPAEDGMTGIHGVGMDGVHEVWGA
jgi:hypothetical protein